MGNWKQDAVLLRPLARFRVSQHMMIILKYKVRGRRGRNEETFETRKCKTGSSKNAMDDES